MWAQLENAQAITDARLTSWSHYHALLAPFEAKALLRRPIIPEHCQHNAHMYYVLLNDDADRDAVLATLKTHEIFSVFHYVPLHNSPAGKRYARTHGTMAVTNRQSARLIRLPLWVGITPEQQLRVVDVLAHALA